MSFDPMVEAFNIAALLKADCMASLEPDQQKPSAPNITNFAEDHSEMSQRTHRVEPPMTIHCKSRSVYQTENMSESENGFEIQKQHYHNKSNVEEL